MPECRRFVRFFNRPLLRWKPRGRRPLFNSGGPNDGLALAPAQSSDPAETKPLDAKHDDLGRDRNGPVRAARTKDGKSGENLGGAGTRAVQELREDKRRRKRVFLELASVRLIAGAVVRGGLLEVDLSDVCAAL